MKKRMSTVHSFTMGTKEKTTILVQKIINQIDRRPIVSFFLVLFLVFLSILTNSILTRPNAPKVAAKVPVKEVNVYSIGSVPTVSLQGKVDKSGIVTIVALTPGIVQNIYVTEGQVVNRGEGIAYLSTNYQGGNAASLGRQIAQAQYQHIIDTYDTQKDLINKQRDLANKSADNADQLRNIASQSINETQNLVNLNQTILDSLSQNLSTLETNNVNGANDAMILSTKQIQAQIQAGLNQTQAGLRTAQYQADTNKSGAQIPFLTHDITVKQLDLQEKSLNLSRETSRLQLQITQVTEAMMFPAAPFSGIVQKVFVRAGQQVNPGTELALISSTIAQTAKVTVYIPENIASRVSQLEDSTIHIKDFTISQKPLYVSDEAVSGTLYAITYVLPDNYAPQVTDKSYIAVDIPVGYPQTTTTDPFVPIDAVYQTSDSSYLYLVKNGHAISQKISLGAIFGRLVEVTEGLSAKDRIILNRNIISGDKVEISSE